MLATKTVLDGPMLLMNRFARGHKMCPAENERMQSNSPLVVLVRLSCRARFRVFLDAEVPLVVVLV